MVVLQTHLCVYHAEFVVETWGVALHASGLTKVLRVQPWSFSVRPGDDGASGRAGQKAEGATGY